ncbi:MAG: hypothetical protein ACI9IP_003481 [Arcticibacterium sp.]|jgi:uncharacterized protein YbjT (DUF2867 family)
MTQKTALIAGASGLIGQELVKYLLNSSLYNKVIILVRRKIDLEHAKLIQEIVDYKNLDLSKIKADHVFCTLGTTIKKAGSKEAFREVDELFPLQVAKQLYKNGAEMYCIVTAMGANASSSIFYNKVKGEVENGLQKIGFKHLGLFRPSMLLGDRKESRIGEEIGQTVMAWLNFLTPSDYKAIHIKKVALAMLQYAEKPKKGLSIVLSGEMVTIKV